MTNQILYNFNRNGMHLHNVIYSAWNFQINYDLGV